jgi:hypothetical protein
MRLTFFDRLRMSEERIRMGGGRELKAVIVSSGISKYNSGVFLMFSVGIRKIQRGG